MARCVHNYYYIPRFHLADILADSQVIVAVDDSEVSRLRDLYVRALANEVPGVRMINANELKEIEPHCRVSETYCMYTLMRAEEGN